MDYSKNCIPKASSQFVFKPDTLATCSLETLHWKQRVTMFPVRQESFQSHFTLAVSAWEHIQCSALNSSNLIQKEPSNETPNSVGLLAAAALLSFVELSGAQILATVTDALCTVFTSQDCAGIANQGCNNTGFTVESSGTYELIASIDECEENEECAECLSVAYIYSQGGTVPVRCVHNACEGSCRRASTSVFLQGHANYVLYSCKIDCNGDCTDCPAGCTARATVATFP
jgi:hypothetical protein